MNTEIKRIIDISLEETMNSLERIDINKIEKIVEVLVNAYKQNRIVFAVGNGGSSSTSAHFVADLSKFATGNKKGFRAIDLGGNNSLQTAWTNDKNWEETWSSILNPWIEKGDILVLFSLHGGERWSNNLSKAIELAKKRGATTIGFSGDKGGYFEEHCDISLVIPPPSDTELTTPITESLHVVIDHIICFVLRGIFNEEN